MNPLRLEPLATQRRAEAVATASLLRQQRAEELRLTKHVADLQKVEATVASITNLVYSDSTESLAKALNFGIATAYPRSVEAVVERGIAAGRPTLKVGILDGGAEPVDPESAHGGGLAAILGFLARVIMVLSTGRRRILILDEPFAAVSSDILTDLSALVRAVVDQLGFQILMVTHQPELADSADVVYRVVGPGKIEKQETN